MDGDTERCAHCGMPSTDDGRFCTNCGALLGTEPTNPRVLPLPGLIGDVTDTAERAYDVPVAAYATAAGPPAATPTAYSSVPPLTPDPGLRRVGPGPGLWIGAAAAMVAVLILGAFLLFQGGGGSGSGSANPPIVPTTHNTPSPSASDTQPASAPTSTSPAVQVTGPPTNVAGFAQVDVPSSAPPGVDFAGQPVTYDGANLVDGLNDTCWRTPGDATGSEITFTLDQPTRLSRVGLVNGYSKIAYSHGRAYDWYLGNRRVLAVEWIFDGGRSVTQQFAVDRAMQQIAIPPVTTRTVRLRITAVSPPGTGRAARNDTAISEVLLLGRTG